MKNSIKTSLLIIFAAISLASCKGGVSGDKQDSTMLDKKAMDSTASQNSKAGTMSGPSGDSSSKNDTTAGTKTVPKQ